MMARWSVRVLIALTSFFVAGCEPRGPETNSHTNWLRSCTRDDECGDLACTCGVCTRSCDADAACAGLAGAACVPSGQPGAIAVCGGEVPTGAGICLPACTDEQCGDGAMCVAGVCSPVLNPTASVSVDTTIRHQVLTGFGATIGYAEEDIVRHERKAALYEAMFAELGVDVLRFRNRLADRDGGDTTAAGEIVRAASASLGRMPLILLSSWSPPAALKANGATVCDGSREPCTLAREPRGGFDYAGFAAYWRESLDAYAASGVFPDYIGIQNNANWIPSLAAPGEACKFLPVEGTTTESIQGVAVSVEYPGFAEALSAVLDALGDRAVMPKIAAPEVSDVDGTASYAPHLDLSRVHAIAHHLYGLDPSAIDSEALKSLGDLGRTLQRPLFQTEMMADGFGTARLMHHALVIEGASAYLQTVFVGHDSGLGANETDLITIAGDDFELEPAYHALRHYALHTDPGWVRVEAAARGENLLASSWLSPAGDALSVILVNAGRTELVVELAWDEGAWPSSAVTRTVFDGVERSAALGALSPGRIVRLPGRSIATVAARR